MNNTVIYTSEQSVLDAMRANGITKVTMFLTMFVNDSNQQQCGYSIINVNSDYYYKQKVISKKTKDFSL